MRSQCACPRYPTWHGAVDYEQLTTSRRLQVSCYRKTLTVFFRAPFVRFGLIASLPLPATPCLLLRLPPPRLFSPRLHSGSRKSVMATDGETATPTDQDAEPPFTPAQPAVLRELISSGSPTGATPAGKGKG